MGWWVPFPIDVSRGSVTVLSRLALCRMKGKEKKDMAFSWHERAYYLAGMETHTKKERLLILCVFYRWWGREFGVWEVLGGNSCSITYNLNDNGKPAKILELEHIYFLNWSTNSIRLLCSLRKSNEILVVHGTMWCLIQSVISISLVIGAPLYTKNRSLKLSHVTMWLAPYSQWEIMSGFWAEKQINGIRLSEWLIR